MATSTSSNTTYFF
jgi:hypothetical protein